MQNRLDLKRMTAAFIALAVILSGCGGGGSNSGKVNGTTFVVNSPAAIAQESADSYDDNVNGLISPATLKRWKDNWDTEKVNLGLTGKLVILQAAAGPAGYEYVKPNGTTVFTYLSPSSEWIQTRINGVIETQSMVPDGATMDALLKKYNIDPRNDMIVVAQGTGSTTNAMAQGRIWYALRYWGVDKKNLALMNGGNQWSGPAYPDGTSASDFQVTASTAPNSGTFTVKSLHVDNTQLQATLEDMLKILPSSDINQKTDGVFIWDARSLGQYSAGYKVENGEDSCTAAYCDPTDASNYMWSFQNSGSRQGHPWGAVQLQYSRLLDSTKGYSYRPKADLAKLLNGESINISGKEYGFVGSDYALLGMGNAYQPGDTIYAYCETTFRAMITGITSAVILGKPTRFYDGAMVEWNSLSNIQDKNGDYILPSDSPWRTDLHSFYRAATSSSLINARTITNPYAASANLIPNSDKAYKSGEAVSSGGGGGLGGNACGG